MEWPAPLTVREVAGELGRSEDDVRALIRDGELQTVACGIRPGSFRVTSSTTICGAAGID